MKPNSKTSLGTEFVQGVLTHTAGSAQESQRIIRNFTLSATALQALEAIRLDKVMEQLQLDPFGLSAEEYTDYAQKITYEISVYGHLIELSNRNLNKTK
jgi:hypothetical protein